MTMKIKMKPSTIIAESFNYNENYRNYLIITFIYDEEKLVISLAAIAILDRIQSNVIYLIDLKKIPL